MFKVAKTSLAPLIVMTLNSLVAAKADLAAFRTPLSSVGVRIAWVASGLTSKPGKASVTG